ncbi:C-X-C motif chemokine 10-like [Neoarius graeffei]|uniref:C-X-C motif chemokine 10-like n=1 Tax=Neoarius graeffei TaxID=443677 RepID=UPI00298C3D48|nr:C-X-C motif chemokine 10-like [Neoarius graeffei]
MSRTVLLLLLGCWLCASFCTAFRFERSERCICQKFSRIPYRKIFEWKLYPPSASCRAYEIVVTTVAGRKMCLNPNSKAWKFIMSGERGPI